MASSPSVSWPSGQSLPVPLLTCRSVRPPSPSRQTSGVTALVWRSVSFGLWARVRLATEVMDMHPFPRDSVSNRAQNCPRRAGDARDVVRDLQPRQAAPFMGVEFRRQLPCLTDEAEREVKLTRKIFEGSSQRRTAVGAGPASHAGGKGLGYRPGRGRPYGVLSKGRDWSSGDPAAIDTVAIGDTLWCLLRGQGDAAQNRRTGRTTARASSDGVHYPMVDTIEHVSPSCSPLNLAIGSRTAGKVHKAVVLAAWILDAG